MRAFIRLRMDREIDKEKHYISPGGYEFETCDGEIYSLDFTESIGIIDRNDSAIIEFELNHADIEAFPEISELQNKLNQVVRISDCYIYTGEHNENTIYPLEILDFQIIDSGVGEKEQMESNEYVTIDFSRNDKTSEWNCIYTFSDILLKTCTF